MKNRKNKTMKKLSILIIVLFFSTQIFSQTKNNQNSLLWEISGNGLKQSSYIFGTIHIIPADDFFFLNIWLEKFNLCKNLVLETDIDLGFFKQLSLLKEMKLPKDTSLLDYMSKDDQLSFTSYMLDSLGVSLPVYNFSLAYMPFFTYSMILNDLIPGKKEFYEKYLSELAKKNKMKIIALETIDFQMNLVINIPIKDQINMFLFDGAKKQYPHVVDDYYKLVKLYKNQDLLQISSQDNSDEGLEFNVNFIVERNLSWVSKIIELIGKKSTFVAVGAAHLPGDDGLIQLLINQGYTVSAILSN